MKVLDELSRKFPHLIIWDPFPLLCKEETCKAFDNEQPLFFDADHLSAYGNRVLYPSFSSLIKKIWEADDKLIISSAIHPNTNIGFNSTDVLYAGWSYPEKNHRWSSGKSSIIKFKLKNIDKVYGDLLLHIATLDQQKIKLTINNHYIGSRAVNSSDANIIFTFDPKILNTDSINIIKFEFPNAHKANNGDPRILAMALKSFIIK